MTRAAIKKPEGISAIKIVGFTGTGTLGLGDPSTFGETLGFTV